MHFLNFISTVLDTLDSSIEISDKLVKLKNEKGQGTSSKNSNFPLCIAILALTIIYPLFLNFTLLLLLITELIIFLAVILCNIGKLKLSDLEPSKLMSKNSNIYIVLPMVMPIIIIVAFGELKNLIDTTPLLETGISANYFFVELYYHIMSNQLNYGAFAIFAYILIVISIKYIKVHIYLIRFANNLKSINEYCKENRNKFLKDISCILILSIICIGMSDFF